MGKFKVGQWVRALVGDGKIAAGEVGKVAEDSRVPFIDWLGGQRWAYIEEELEPWTPRVGERVRFTQDNLDGGGKFGATGDVVVVAAKVQDGGMHGRYIRFTWPHHDWNPAAPLSCIEPVAAETPQAKLQIEAGKFYKTRDGRKVGPMVLYRPDKVEWIISRGDGNIWLADGSHKSDCEGGGLYMSKSGDLVSEWFETASNDNAPIAEQPPAKPAKFKVGDRVLVTGCEPQLVDKRGMTGTVHQYSGSRIPVELSDGKTLYFSEGELTIMNQKQAIVALIENGKPKPADRPHVHASAEVAQKEAERLANKFKGKQFGVYVLSSISEQAKPVHDHKWQRLAADGLKIDAIKELRGITGMGLKPAKDAVEYFLQAA